MEGLEFGISNKGTRTVIYKQYEYIRNRITSAGVSHWRCNKYQSLRCKSVIHTRENQVVREPVEHNHSARNFEGQARKLVNEMKLAMTYLGASTRLTMANGMDQASKDIQMALPKRNSLIRRLQRAKSRRTEAAANINDIKDLLVLNNPKTEADENAADCKESVESADDNSPEEESKIKSPARTRPPATPKKRIKRAPSEKLPFEITAVLQHLDKIAQNVIEDKPFEQFGKFIASELRQLPQRQAIILQHDIQNCIIRSKQTEGEGSGSSNDDNVMVMIVD